MITNESRTKRANRIKREEISKEIKKNPKLNVHQLSDLLGIKTNKLQRIALEFNILIPRKQIDDVGGPMSATAYLKRAVLKYIKANPDVNYIIVGNRFGTSPSYVGRIARSVGITKNISEEEKKKIKNTIAHINLDFELGMSYEDIKKTYNFDENKEKLTYYGLGNLKDKFRTLRNDEISRQYKVKTAMKVMVDTNVKLDSPDRIKTLSQTYGVACKNGFKKYPKIGDRSKGGTFEDRKILRYIEKLRDKDGLTFQEIADKLTRQGKKTLTGVPFSMANALYKYNAYKKNKYKRLTY
jgi:hypothetical protein